MVGIEPRVTSYLDYATGGFTTQYAAMLVASGVCDTVACVFGANPRQATVADSGAYVYDRTYGLVNAGAIAALGWTRYMSKHETVEEDLGAVAVTFRRHARLNPNSAFTEPLTLDDYLATSYTVWPFRELDICKVTAGGAALIITAADRAGDHPKAPVYIGAVGRQQAPLELAGDEHLMCYAMTSVAEQAYREAGIGPGDVDLLMATDSSTAAVIHTLENYGFCPQGGGGRFVREGGIALDGEIPMNPDGGQLSGGYLLGWLHQVEAVRQLRGECGERQVAGARIAQYATTGRWRTDFLSTIYVAE
jgi:acetyl-CoA acetyltransferase